MVVQSTLAEKYALFQCLLDGFSFIAIPLYQSIQDMKFCAILASCCIAHFIMSA